MKYRVNASATYFLEIEVEAENTLDAKNKARELAAEERDDADEWDAHYAVPLSPSNDGAPK